MIDKERSWLFRGFLFQAKIGCSVVNNTELIGSSKTRAYMEESFKKELLKYFVYFFEVRIYCLDLPLQSSESSRLSLASLNS